MYIYIYDVRIQIREKTLANNLLTNKKKKNNKKRTTLFGQNFCRMCCPEVAADLVVKRMKIANKTRALQYRSRQAVGPVKNSSFPRIIYDLYFAKTGKRCNSYNITTYKSVYSYNVNSKRCE